MENKNNQNQANGTDINTDALNDTQTQTVMRPKMNLSPNSKHQSGSEATINPENQVGGQQTVEPSNDESSGQTKESKNTNMQEDDDTTSNKQTDTTPEVPLPERTNGGMVGSQSPKTDTGMSDNIKYLLIGLLIVVLVAGGIVAWNMFFTEDEQSAPAQEQQTEEPVDTDEPAVTADTTSPDVTITTPESDTTVSGTFVIEGTFSDESTIETLVLYMNDSMAEEITNPTDDTFSIEIDSLNFANGTYVAYVAATDSEGNVGESREVTVEITNEPPEEEVTEEAEDEPTTDEPTSLPRTGAGWR